ncbi:hypothetical protein A3J78_00420 [Candidatus Beckwithbacteria bacterium RBG_13_35_6]|uniref:Uncharacterized protein n=1 Tax=Candidatus Beckwithbacteria bacterium RBG_13_35_6 TaxID=1797456 RepID=A0A1F5DDI2_9BACT|nr:MAG: hypothetical protein A3J78_00420 [Candidatus Beckwithbacteria bacterium RBG_13_35_6]
MAFTGNKEKSKFAFFTSLKTQLKQLVFNKSLFNIKNIIKLVFVILIISLIGFVGLKSKELLNPITPEISLDKPTDSFVNKGEKLFISGKVKPANSQVEINKTKVALNGDGTFTAIINIPLGESVLELTAKKGRKTAKLLRLVQREPTEEELQAKKEELEDKKKEAANKAAELDKQVNDLMAAKNASAKKENVLKIINNQVKEEAGFYSIEGEVTNISQDDVRWVMITAKLFDASGNRIDEKYGFATDFGEVIKPGQQANFETQPTTKNFDHYSLDVSWEGEGDVAGVKDTKEATKAGEKELQ